MRFTALGRGLVATVALAFTLLALPAPAAACSCVAPLDVLDGAAGDPGAAVFTARPGPRVGDAIPVAVSRWLHGLPPAGPVVLQGADPNDMCGSTSPPPGAEYLFVTYTSETSRFAISGCSVQADVSTADGVAMLARAIERYGPGLAPSAEPIPAPMPTSSMADAVVPVAIGGLVALGAVAGLAWIVRRRGVER